jgi:hypothetical protein
MALITGFVPVEQGVAAWVSLDRDARSRRAGGDPRSLSQIMADTFIERLTGQANAAAVPVEIGLTLTVDSLLRRSDNTPATLPGYGPIPAEFARELAGVRGEPDDLGPVAAEARVFIRRILTDPIDHTVVSVDTRRRRFDGALARYLLARDQHCRMPYCTAPIRHLDHVTPWRDGGPTTAANGQGLCERHSYVKEVPGWKIRVVEPKRPAASTDGRATVTPDARPGRHTTITTTPTGHTYQSHAPPA